MIIATAFLYIIMNVIMIYCLITFHLKTNNYRKLVQDLIVCHSIALFIIGIVAILLWQGALCTLNTH